MKQVTLRIVKATEHEVCSALQRAEVLRSNLSNLSWAKDLDEFADSLVHDLSFAKNCINTIRSRIELQIPEKTFTAQRIIDDLMALTGFVQAHEEMFDNLNTNFSIDEMLTIAAQRVKEHADMMFAKKDCDRPQD